MKTLNCGFRVVFVFWTGEEGLMELVKPWLIIRQERTLRAVGRPFRKGYGGRPVTIGSLIYYAINSGFKFDESKKVSHIIQQRAERKNYLK